jgi:DNA-binding CsgD family transcriptional regulator
MSRQISIGRSVMPQKNRVLTANQAEVVRWLATPQESRQPKTEAELAKEMGVRPATVSKWRKKLDLDAHASEIVRQELYSHLPEVYGVLVETARTGSIDHMKLLLEVAEGIGNTESCVVSPTSRISQISSKDFDASSGEGREKFSSSG